MGNPIFVSDPILPPHYVPARIGGIYAEQMQRLCSLFSNQCELIDFKCNEQRMNAQDNATTGFTPFCSAMKKCALVRFHRHVSCTHVFILDVFGTI